MMGDNDLHVTGTLVWYYYICKREVWLMARHLVPDEDNPNIDLGRFIGEHTYRRDKKEITVDHIKLDILRKEKGQLVVGEVKKSSKYEKSATMQLAFYLMELREKGVDAVGELLFPKEKKKTRVEINDELIVQIENAKKEILKIVYQETPPLPQKINYCRNCAYAELCWS
jgi:CRISPR-associated exonuclease Cas4